MRCTGCDTELKEDCHYCPRCGKPSALAAGAQTVAVSDSAANGEAESAEAAEAPGAVAACDTLSAVGSLDERALSDLLTRANLCRAREQYAEAVDLCVTALRSDPRSAAAHSLLGDIYRDRKRPEDARQWYRMAIDLEPNASDEAKLRRLEGPLPLAARRDSDRPAALAFASGGAVEGTALLLGVSPQRWLRGITYSSLLFLVAVLLFLIGGQASRPRDGGVGLPMAQGREVAPGLDASSGPLPAAQIGGAASSPNNGQAARPQAAPMAGVGIAPDQNTPGQPTLPTFATAPGQPAPRITAPQRNMAAPREVAPASVRQVRPMEPVPSASGEAPPPPMQSTVVELGDGMHLEQTQLSGETVNALVIAPNRPVSDPGFHDALIRNAVRAANVALGDQRAAQSARVFLQTGRTEAGGAVLLVAELSRQIAAESRPEESPELLQQRFTSYQWGAAAP